MVLSGRREHNLTNTLKKSINDFEHKDDVQNGDPASPAPPQPTQPESVYTRLALAGMSVGFLPDAQ